MKSVSRDLGIPHLPAALVLGGVGLAALLLLAGCASRSDLATVSRVDLPRYAGRWYEIASYPAWFQRKCAGDVTADYTPQPDGSIRVVNRCRTRAGTFEESEGRATVVRGSGGAKLKVSFGVPFVTGDYWIVALDERDYQWALVGHPSRKYLWILSRQPRISDALYGQIVARARAAGYDPSRLRRTVQGAGR